MTDEEKKDTKLVLEAFMSVVTQSALERWERENNRAIKDLDIAICRLGAQLWFYPDFYPSLKNVNKTQESER